MAKPMFTDQIVKFIIDNVHDAEFMWNNTNPLYKLKHLKNDFWLKLTKEINMRFNPIIKLFPGLYNVFTITGHDNNHVFLLTR